MAKSYSPPLHIQTHISENVPETELVRDVFPDCDGGSYAAVYDKFGLLTDKTILAHAVHLSEDEKKLVRARSSKVSHCPASNSALGSGLCPVRSLVDSGITVGLGTDVSGGFSSSILEQVRQACLVSRLLKHAPGPGTGTGVDSGGRESLSVEEGLYLATRGGAEVVDMSAEIGGFEIGMRFDAQLVGLGGDVGASGEKGGGNVDVFGWESWTERIHKWVWCGDDRNVRAVWVNGRLVHGVAG